MAAQVEQPQQHPFCDLSCFQLPNQGCILLGFGSHINFEDASCAADVFEHAW